MHVISRKPLRDFAAHHSGADQPLRSWFKLMTASKASNLAELKRTFSTADYVSVKQREIYVFNVGGNKYRIVSEINFKRQMAYIRFVLTHNEYTTGQWKAAL
jgi:mRNA interferase HigB